MEVTSKQKSFQQAVTLLKNIKMLQTILKEHWKSFCWNSYWRNIVNISHSSTIDSVQVETIYKANFTKTPIKSQCLVSPGQSLQQDKWRFMPVNMNVYFTSSSYPLSISSSAMPFQPKLLQLLNHQPHQWQKQQEKIMLLLMQATEKCQQRL